MARLADVQEERNEAGGINTVIPLNTGVTHPLTVICQSFQRVGVVGNTTTGPVTITSSK